jgi:hypothetical protein
MLPRWNSTVFGLRKSAGQPRIRDPLGHGQGHLEFLRGQGRRLPVVLLAGVSPSLSARPGPARATLDRLGGFQTSRYSFWHGVEQGDIRCRSRNTPQRIAGGGCLGDQIVGHHQQVGQSSPNQLMITKAEDSDGSRAGHRHIGIDHGSRSPIQRSCRRRGSRHDARPSVAIVLCQLMSDTGLVRSLCT